MTTEEKISITFLDRATAEQYSNKLLDTVAMLRTEIRNHPNTFVSKNTEDENLIVYIETLWKKINMALYTANKEQEV